MFYSIDARRQSPDIDLLGERGFWILAGSPQALAKPDAGTVASFLYDTSVHRRVTFDGWDYLFVNLNLKQNPELPTSYRGVSGGGIWRALFSTSEDETLFAVENARRDIVLSGVAFYQTDEEGRQVVAHGPLSLYETLVQRAVDAVT